MALLIKADGSREEITGADNGKLTYKQVREIIGGGLVQLVPCDPEKAEGHVCFYCDEEGKLKHFPVNEEATKLAVLFPGDFLVGDILFVRREEDMD